MSHDDLYYDPYDVEIDADPYPTYRRLRDEAPLYYNERYDFWALSRFADVEQALEDWQRLSSAKGDILEVVKADPVMPPGVFINEDPPLHTVHADIDGPGLGLDAGDRRLKGIRRWTPTTSSSCDATCGT